MNDFADRTEPDALPVVIVGGGFAGVAAAWAAARARIPVVLIHGAAGASALYSGIVDGPRASAEVSELSRALGLCLAPEPRAVATREGVIRVAQGRDAALLDLDSLEGRRIAVADIGRDDWDPRLLARSYAESSWAQRTQTQFHAVRVAALALGAERRIAPYDLAVILDAPDRLQALAQALLTADSSADAWLFGPWLGVRSNVASNLSALIGRPVGEVSSPPGGAAGARFELRREQLLAERGIRGVTAHVRAVTRSPNFPSYRGSPPLQVDFENSAPISARAVVLATGGVVAGGIRFGETGATPSPAYRLSLEVPVLFELDGQIVDGLGSLGGVSFQRWGLDALRRLGLRVGAGAQACADLPVYAAGDVVANRPRTVLEALTSGVNAGARAALTEPQIRVK